MNYEKLLKVNMRKADFVDVARLTEIEIFNYRLYLYPIFKNDDFYFRELNIIRLAENYLAYLELLDRTYVYDDGVVKGFCRGDGIRLEKLFVEPVLQGQGIGSALLTYAMENHHANGMWVLEKNIRAIRFYERYGFRKTDRRIPEEDTTEFLVWMERTKA